MGYLWPYVRVKNKKHEMRDEKNDKLNENLKRARNLVTIIKKKKKIYGKLFD